MSDARDKLQATIAAKKKAGPATPKAPPKKKAPSKTAPPSRSASSSAPAKPEKAKSSFLKKKKSKQKPAAAKKSSGGAFGAAFSKMAKTFVDELKDATSEISPGQLLETAKDGISNLGIGKVAGEDASEVAADVAEAKGRESAPGSSGARPGTDSPVSDTDNTPVVEEIGDEAPKQFSTVKVQKAPPARRKAKPRVQETEPVAADDAVQAPEDAAPSVGSEADTPGTSHEQDSGPVKTPSENATLAADEPGEPTSPTKMQRAPKKKQKSDDPEPVPSEGVETAEEDATLSTDAPPEPETESASPETTSPEEEPAVTQEPPTAEKAPKPTGTKKGAKRAPKQTVHVSNEEQLVRAFHSLHRILNCEIWNPIVTDPNSKPSSIFASRALFEKLWSTPEFREGLKAASRLASGYTFEPVSIEFDARAIEAVKAYELDPQNAIRPHTELISKAIGSKVTDEVLELLKKGPVKKLLYSVGTRLSTFVPTIEILARIYIGLRKKEDIIPGDRLMIQEEVLMKYNKSPYTEDMGKKAQNLSLNYFVDYLTEYGFKLYKDRMEQAPEGQNHFSAHKRRHETIKKSCNNLVREWGTKVGVSTSAMMNLEGRLMEMADNYIAALVGEVPDDE